MSGDELLIELVKEAKTPDETIRILLDKGIVSTTALRDLEVYYTYRNNIRISGIGGIMAAIYDTSISTGVSDRTVWRARKRFED